MIEALVAVLASRAKMEFVVHLVVGWQPNASKYKNCNTNATSLCHVAYSASIFVGIVEILSFFPIAFGAMPIVRMLRDEVES